MSSANRSPHRLKKSKTELPPPLTKPATPPLTPARLPSLTTAATISTPSRPTDIDHLDEQLSAVTLRDSSVLTLCDSLTVAEEGTTKERRLALVRGIRDKLIGSESNKALCVHFKHHRSLTALLTQSLEADEADEAEFRLQLLTALSSLATGSGEAQQQLQRDGMLDVLFECVRSGQQPLVDAAIVALRPLLFAASTMSPHHSSAITTAFSHVDLVLHLICCFRQWQTHTSDAAAAALTAMASGSLVQQLCLIQHGLLPVLMSHLATYQPSLPSQPVSAPFIASLRLLSALCHRNVYLVASLSLPASHSQSSANLYSHSAAAATCSLFPYVSSLLLHPQSDVRLHSATLIVRCALAHVRLQRSKRCELEAEDRLVRDSELLRLHREWTASPMSKRGRAGNAKGGNKRQPPPSASDTFSLQQWIGALQPLLVSCTVSSTSPFASAVTVLSPLLSRVLQVLVRLVQTGVNEVAVEAMEALSEVLDGWDCGHDELAEQLLKLALDRLVHCSVTSPAPRDLPDTRPPLLRLLYVLCQHERYRRTVLSCAAHWSQLIVLCDSPSPEVQFGAMYVVGQLVLSCRVQQSTVLCHSSNILQPLIALLVSRLTAAGDEDVRPSEAAMYAISCLSRPHAFRSLVVDEGKAEMLAALLRWMRDDTADEQSKVGGQGVSVLWRRASSRQQRRLHTLTAIANLVFRCDKDMQRRVIDGLGGWPQLLAMLEGRVQSGKHAADSELLCGMLDVTKQLVGAALRHETDDEMYDWVAAKRQPVVKRDTSEPVLKTDELSALLITLAPLLSTAASGVLLPSLLAVLVNVSSHPRVSATLLLASSASSAVLQCVLQGLRSSPAEHRELAVLVLYNVLLLVVDDRQQRKDNDTADSTELPLDRLTSSSGRSRAAFGKRRRSTNRPTDDSMSARRTRRRSDSNNNNSSDSSTASRRDTDGMDEADTDSTAGSDQKVDEQQEVTYLVRLSTAGVIAELLRLDEAEVDGAVLGRVRRVLLLLRMIAAVSSSQSNKQLLMQLRALEVDVEDELDSHNTMDADADEDEDERQARELEDVRLRGMNDERKESEESSVRVRWRSTMSGSRLGREAWMARHRALARVREAAEVEERRYISTDQQQQQHGSGDDGDEKQYDSHSPGSGEDDAQLEREGHAESLLLRHYVREWMTQPNAPRPTDIDAVFGRLFRPFDSSSHSSASSSSSSSSAASATSLSATTAASVRHPAQSPFPLHSVLSSALDRRSRRVRAMASAMGVRLADQQRNAQSGSRRGEARR